MSKFSSYKQNKNFLFLHVRTELKNENQELKEIVKELSNDRKYNEELITKERIINKDLNMKISELKEQFNKVCYLLYGRK